MSKQKIGYARVSTEDQHLDLQLDALKKAGCSVIYEEKISGKSRLRPELTNCLKALRSGDTLVVWRLDRLGRSLPDLVHIVTELEGKGIGFESLTERIETSSAAGKLIFHVFASLAEFERNLIRERTRAGLSAARARGRVGGRKRKLGEKDIREIKALMRDPAIKVSDIASRYGVARSTLYKAAQETSIENLKGMLKKPVKPVSIEDMSPAPRRLGQLKGQVKTAEDFDTPAEIVFPKKGAPE